MAVQWKQVLKAGDNISLLNNDEFFSSSGAVTALNNATQNEICTIGATTTELEAETGFQYSGGDLSIDRDADGNATDDATITLKGGSGIGGHATLNLIGDDGEDDLDSWRVFKSGNNSNLTIDSLASATWSACATFTNSLVTVNAGSLAVTNVKAVDGTSAISIANSTGAVTLAGDLIVSGTTTTVSSTTITVADKNIQLANVNDPTKDTASGGGIQLETSATEADFPEIKWTKDLGGGNTDGTAETGGLTGWSVSNMHTSNPEDVPIAVMKYKAGNLSNEIAGGVGSFGYDTANDLLYVRISNS